MQVFSVKRHQQIIITTKISYISVLDRNWLKYNSQINFQNSSVLYYRDLKKKKKNLSEKIVHVYAELFGRMWWCLRI